MAALSLTYKGSQFRITCWAAWECVGAQILLIKLRVQPVKKIIKTQSLEQLTKIRWSNFPPVSLKKTEGVLFLLASRVSF